MLRSGGLALLLMLLAFSSSSRDRAITDTGDTGWRTAAAAQRRRLKEKTSASNNTNSSTIPAQAQENEQGRFHPDKAVVHKANEEEEEEVPTIDGTSSAGATNSNSQSQVVPTAAGQSAMRLPSTYDGNEEGANNNSNNIDNTLNSTTVPYYDENNTVEVSISLALPLAWNLTSTENNHAVDSLVEDASEAATQLFHTTLSHTITIIDGYPQAQSQGIAKAEEDTSVVNKPRIPQSEEQYYSDLNISNAGGSTESWNGDYSPTERDDQNSSVYYNTSDSDMPPKETSETVLWEWLGMVPFSEEELYRMVLDFLEIETEEDWRNATLTSPLLRSLKPEIRNAIYVYFFQELQRQAHYNTTGKEAYTNDTRWWNATSTEWNPDSTSDYYYNPQENQQGGQANQFYSSGLWEMFLADTRVKLVMVDATYAWWKLTMIYPVYIQYQPVASLMEKDDMEDAAFGNATAAEAAPYWEPVTDQGTLDFISRLLRRVLLTAVESGAFLSSLQESQAFGAAQTMVSGNIVDEILGLTVPGREYEIQELISPYDDQNEDMASMTEIASVPRDDEPPPQRHPWETGTYTEPLLESSDGSKRRRMGIILLLLTGSLAGAMVLSAYVRKVSQNRAMVKGFLLGTEQDVSKLLHVGWRHYDVPVESQLDGVDRGEIVEVFDKSKEGYYDNDSMLHGSAMQQSGMYDSASEVHSVPMEYEKHLERHQGRVEDNMFKALEA